MINMFSMITRVKCSPVWPSISAANKIVATATCMLLLMLFRGQAQPLSGRPGPLSTRTVDTPCRNPYFIHTYYNENEFTEPNSGVLLNDNSTVVCGTVSNKSIGDNQDALLYKVGADGRKIWEKVYGGQGNQSFHSIIRSNDGNLLAGGYLTDLQTKSGFFLTKMDTDGNTAWKKVYNFQLGTFFDIRGLHEDKDGSIYLTCYYLENNLSMADRVLYIKADANGNLVYARSIKTPGLIGIVQSYHSLLNGDYTYIVGNFADNSTHWSGALLKIRNSDGSLVWTKYYDFNNGVATFFQIALYKGKDLCIFGTDNLNPSNTSLILLCDTDGNVLSSSSFKQADLRKDARVVVEANGDVTWATNYSLFSNGGKSSLSITKLNPVTGILWARNYPQVQTFPRTMQIQYGTDGSLFFSGYVTVGLYGSKLYHGRLAPDGQGVCEPEPLNPVFSAGTSVARTVTLLVSNLAFTPSDLDWQPVQNKINASDTLCSTPNPCTFLGLAAPATVCQRTDTLTVQVSKAPDCTLTPSFAYDPGIVSLIRQDRLTARFLLLKPGKAKIYASMSPGCSLYQDSIEVTIRPSPGKVELGADMMLCTGARLQLNAHAGYTTYQWQDGSADSLFLVNSPGSYSVSVADGCGNLFRDTVEIKAAPLPVLNLGPGLVKCNNDTLVFTAPAGFAKYSWSPSSGISDTSAQTVRLYPGSDTYYAVGVQNAAGCHAVDSLKVSVRRSPPVNLGPDRMLCHADSVLLDAGAGFDRYMWSTGALSRTLKANSKGVYSVVAITQDGCSSADTMQVSAVFPAITINFNHDSTLCAGSARVLDAGRGFSAYRWSNGSTMQAIALTQTGKYSVYVTDVNGCTGGDSVQIKRILAIPAHFLPPDTAVCSYGSILLQSAAPYASYLWNTGEAVRSITIKQAGRYWLEVRDNNGCKGRDTAEVAGKQCMKGFWVPSAFTPNGDGKNDVFRPLIFGNIERYSFAVYNRWGEKIFESREPGEGWNGTAKGVANGTTTYVWICSYQLAGEPAHQEKGTVILVR